MHESLLRRAANPAPYRIMGLSLRPFSIGHALLISDEGPPAPLAGPGDAAGATATALASAVLICANTWQQNLSLRTDPLFALKIKIWRWRNRHSDYIGEASAFRRYVEDGSLDLPISERGRSGNSRISGAPFLLRLQQWLMLE